MTLTSERASTLRTLVHEFATGVSTANCLPNTSAWAQSRSAWLVSGARERERHVGLDDGR